MKKTGSVALTGLFSAIIALSAWISIPSVIPFTLQTMAVILAAGTLGIVKGTVAVAAYIGVGLAGVPVFSNFSGGIGVLFSPTGGFILGFLLLALSVGCAKTFFKGKKLFLILFSALGLLLCYLFGTLWFMFCFNEGQDTSFITAITACVLPFILPDTVKTAAAIYLIRRLKKAVKI